MKIEFTKTGIGVHLSISEEGEPVAECHLSVLNVHAEKLSSSKYQITETPEPVTVLDIQYPVKIQSRDDAKLLGEIADHNGLAVVVLSKTGFISRIKLSPKADKVYPIHHKWLKQKPAEPTREELQGRLSRINDYIDETHKPGLVNGEMFRVIMDIATGEK